MGGYDDGYEQCACFWGSEPGSLVRSLVRQLPTLSGLRILDAGCGEGKNAIALARMGAIVDAVDTSSAALKNAEAAWSDASIVNWQQADVRQLVLQPEQYDVIIAYGLLHCLASVEEIRELVGHFQLATKCGGYNVICSFNDRHQELTAHPGFAPCLVPHSLLVSLYSRWHFLTCSDKDLVETHPHNDIRHSHSMTRYIARKVRP